MAKWCNIYINNALLQLWVLCIFHLPGSTLPAIRIDLSLTARYVRR